MPATSLLPSQAARFNLGAQDNSGTGRPASFSVKVADYSLGYVFAQGNQIYFVPKALGSTSITVSGTANDGTALPPLSFDFVTAMAPPPEATHFTADGIQVLNQDITTPADPGSDTVTGSL